MIIVYSRSYGFNSGLTKREVVFEQLGAHILIHDERSHAGLRLQSLAVRIIHWVEGHIGSVALHYFELVAVWHEAGSEDWCVEN